MKPHASKHHEVGRTRIVFAPELELTLPAAQELVSMIEHASGVKGMTVHWQADDRSPEVLVRAGVQHFERVVDKLLAGTGGFGILGTPGDPVPVSDETRRGRALVVSSDSAMREIATMFLHVLGLEPEVAETLAEAEACVRREEYDVLVVATLDAEADDVGTFLTALEPQLGMSTPVVFWTEAFLADVPGWLSGLRAPLLLMSRPNDFHDFRDKLQRALEWRHLVRLRRRVRAHVEEEVIRRMRAFAADLLGPTAPRAPSAEAPQPQVVACESASPSA